MNPREHSLRELALMAKGKKRVMGSLAAWHVAMILSRLPLTAVNLNPNEINPFGDEPSPESTEEAKQLREWQEKKRFEAGCKAMARKR